MTGAPRRVRDRAPAIFSFLVSAVAIVAVGCGTATPSQTAAPSRGPSGTSAGASLTPVPGGPSDAAPSAAASPPTTSTVEGFGVIWDALPPSFPKVPGAVPADESRPASGLFGIVVGNATDAAASMRAALTVAGWSVDVGSPLEDGTVVLAATGSTPGCRAQIRFTPVSGSLVMEVLYGASCPFD